MSDYALWRDPHVVGDLNDTIPKVYFGLPKNQGQSQHTLKSISAKMKVSESTVYQLFHLEGNFFVTWRVVGSDL